MKVKIYLDKGIVYYKDVLSILPPCGKYDKWVSLIGRGETAYFEASTVKAITFEEEDEKNDVES